MMRIIAALVLGAVSFARPVAASEPIKCYELAWGTKDEPGLGLTAGQAVDLCSGATDANKVIQCMFKAWSHPGNGGLGLTAGQAVSLCRTIPSSPKPF
jgi:hypothetical protein